MSYVGYNLMGTDIVAGINAIEALPKKLQVMKIQKPLLVTDIDIVKSESMKKIEAFLKNNNINYIVYSDVERDPYDYMVEAGVKVYKENECDGIIAFGGGSTMDCGKGISIMSVHDGNIIQYGHSTPNHLNFTRPGCPIITIPTTSGTGSEVSRFAVITNSKTHQKRNIASNYIMSKFIILDPTYATTMSSEVTAYTGFDALCHAIEAYTTKKVIGQQIEISDTLALRAIELISQNLVKAYNDPNNLNVRFNMQWAAMLAGLALNIGTGECHGIGSYLSKYYPEVTHGISVGIPLPYVMQNNITYCPDRFYAIAKALGQDTNGLSIEKGAALAPKAVKILLENVNFPVLKDYCKTFEDVEAFCEEACHNSCCVSNGRIITEQVMKKILRKCYDQIL